MMMTITIPMVQNTPALTLSKKATAPMNQLANAPIELPSQAAEAFVSSATARSGAGFGKKSLAGLTASLAVALHALPTRVQEIGFKQATEITKEDLTLLVKSIKCVKFQGTANATTGRVGLVINNRGNLQPFSRMSSKINFADTTKLAANVELFCDKRKKHFLEGFVVLPSFFNRAVRSELTDVTGKEVEVQFGNVLINNNPQRALLFDKKTLVIPTILPENLTPKPASKPKVYNLNGLIGT